MDGSARDIRNFKFLLEVTRETLSSLQIESVLRRVVNLLRHQFEYDYAAIWLVENDRVIFRAGSAGEWDSDTTEKKQRALSRIPIGKGVIGTAISTGKPLIVNEVNQSPLYISADFLPNTRAELAVPLIQHDHPFGVIDVQSNNADAFNEADVEFLEIVGALVGPVIQLADLYATERRRSRDMHLVGEISRLVMSSLDRDKVITVACESILEAMDVTYVGVALLDGPHERIFHRGHATRVPLLRAPAFSVSLGEGMVGKVVKNGISMRLDDVGSLPDFLHVLPDIRSALCVPLKVKEQIIGAVITEHIGANHFLEEDEQLLENLATYLAQAVENALLYHQKQTQWQQLQKINEIARITTQTFDLEHMLALVAEELHERFGYYAVALKLNENDKLVIHSLACDDPLELAVGTCELLTSGPAGKVFQSRQAMLLPSEESLPPSVRLHHHMKCGLIVPLIARQNPIGVIEVQSPELYGLNSEDLLIIETVSKSVAGAIANARLIQQTAELRSDLNRMVVHDLRNPIQAVLLTLQEALQHGGPVLAPHILEMIKEGVASTEELLTMVNSLLDVSRFEAGKAILRPRPAILNDHIRAVVRRFAPIARAKGIQVTTILSQEIPVLRLDHELIARMLANLIGNAIKFTPNNARVTILSELITEPLVRETIALPFVHIAIKDTGDGIPEAFHEKIFEKFGQVESRKAGLSMSTGLGLTFCRYVAEAHGGDIWVESASGKGASFMIALPITSHAQLNPR